MPLAEKDLLRCEQCGAPLDGSAIAGSATGCLNCLLLGGPNEGLKPSEENRRFQHYEVSLLPDGMTLRELGRGAMGVTYHAVDINLGSPVALKVISARYSGDSAARERFRREAQATARLRHPNVATVFHFGETPAGQRFYAMELVEGETLEARVRRDGPLSVSLALSVAEQITRALVAAEKHALVHRDLKPSNVMIVSNSADSDDLEALAVKVIDFGLAKAAATTEEKSDRTHTSFSGTPGFASPEQFATGDVLPDTRSDIYSLGATLWYMLCGESPFTGRTLSELREQQSRQPPVEQLSRAKVPACLVALLRSMLATSPTERPQSATELLAELRQCREVTEGRPGRRRLLQLAALMLLIMSGVSLTSYLLYRQYLPKRASIVGIPVPEKSIAVLPFENLSNNGEDASFVDGIQDDILTKLAKIADLKVISRTSVMQYRRSRNLHEIGDALRVSYVLEGSVRKIGDRLHVNAQLIDTRTDTHVWAEEYDRDVRDVFAIQGEIAQTIAGQLHARILPSAKLAIERPTTSDLTAFDLYSRANNLLLATSLSSTVKADLLQAVDLLNQAVANDPSFFHAYCQLAHTHDLLYFFGFDHTPARLALAEAAIAAAFRLRLDAGEAHLARAENLYRGYLDHEGALAELEIARQSLPNDPKVFFLKGNIERRQGRWEESTRNLERAVELDPRNVLNLQQIAGSYRVLRRYADEKSALDRVLAIEPNDIETRVARAFVELNWKADTRPLHRLIDSVRATNPSALANVADVWLTCALAERDAAAAEKALTAAGETPPMSDLAVHFNRLFMEGVIARMLNDQRKAEAAFAAARVEQEKTIHAQPDYGPPLCVLGLIDAALGRKDEALHEGRRAVELLPIEKDSINGPLMIAYSAMIAGWAGEKDLACDRLAAAIRYPGPISYGQLKLLPFWDPLRGHPRFEKIVASLEPK